MAPTPTHGPFRRPVVALRRVSNQRGNVLGLVALLLIVFLGLAALAIDLGLLYVARGEAQRSADAAAHAGAVHLLRAPFDEDGARDRAVRAAAANVVRGQSTEIRWLDDIDVVLDSQKVRARVHRTDSWGGAIGTLFARVIGFQSVGVATSAAAQAWPGEAADCIMPFAIPDHWYVDEDGNYRDAGIGDTYINDEDRQDLYIPAADPDHDLVPDGYPADEHPGYTGYGKDRIGQEIQLTTADPSESPQPGWYYPIRLPGSQGGADYKASIEDCWEPSGEHQLEDEVDKEPGNMVGPTQQGFASIFNDPDEQNIAWDDSPEWNCPRRTDGEDGAFIEDGDCVTEGSRRVRPLVMFDPEEWENIANGAKPVPITAIAGIFLDSWDGGNSVVVRFMTYTSTKPSSDWEMCADCLLRTVRIVE
jgi:hypothetical protein